MKHNRNLLNAQLPDVTGDREEEKQLATCDRQEDQLMEEDEDTELEEEAAEENVPVVLKTPSIESSSNQVASTANPSAPMSPRR